MALLKCKMCGGDLAPGQDESICQCPYCGTSQTIPHSDGDKKARLFARAENLRRSSEFDDAAHLYETIVAEYPDDAEGYWGLLLSRYGVEYVEDPATRNMVPTCHRASFDSIFESDCYRSAIEKSDAIARRLYISQAQALEEVREGVIKATSSEEAYDVFICYKETSEEGGRTEESVIAQEVYEKLIESGFHVFFSRITLEDKLGSEYEPVIFSALNSARVMLVFGTKKKHLNEAWVKNEWSRYLKLIERGDEKTLIPCYKGMSPEDLPKKLSHLQGQDLSKLGYVQDIVRGVTKLIGSRPESPTAQLASTVHSPSSATRSPLTQRGLLALEDGEFIAARNYFDRALDQDPTDGYAYFGTFLANRRIVSLDALADEIVGYGNDKNFNRALQFADAELSATLRTALDRNDANIAEKERKQKAEEEANRAREQRQHEYDEAYDRVEAQVNKELSALWQEIDARYEPSLSALRSELGAKEAAAMHETVRLQAPISQVRRELASLGFFDRARKSEIEHRVSVLNAELQATPSAMQLREEYRPKIDEITNRRDEEKRSAELEVRKRHPLPAPGAGVFTREANESFSVITEALKREQIKDLADVVSSS
ncbi:MAG: TIR domain-containing protein [Adlercreutzia sp.]|nr:TIR domain-containing protein [Adlercreutzia sp.]